MQKQKVNICFILLLLIPFYGLTQDTLDFYIEDPNIADVKEYYNSLVENGDHRKIAELFSRTAVHKATDSLFMESIGYFESAIEKFQTLGDNKEVAINLNFLSNVYFEIGRHLKAIRLLEKAIELDETLKDTVAQTRDLNNLGFVYYNTFKLSKAIETFYKSAQLNEKMDNKDELSKVYYYIGNVYLDQKSLDSSLTYFKKTYQLDSILQDTSNLISSINNLSVVYYKMLNFSKSNELLEKALEIAQKSKDLKQKAAIFNNLGNQFYNKKLYSKALINYNQSLTIKKDQHLHKGALISAYNIANVYIKLDSLNKALNLLLSQLSIAEQYQNSELLSKSYLSISSIYKKMNKHEDAFVYYRKYVNSLSSFFTENVNSPISEIQDKYSGQKRTADALKKEIEMQKLYSLYEDDAKNKEIQILQNEQKIQENLNKAIIIATIFLLLSLAFVFMRFRIKRKSNIEIDQQNQEIEKQNKVIEQQRDSLFDSNKELEKLSIVARDTDNAVLILNEQGEFEWINEGYTKLFGYTFNELLEKSKTLIGSDTPDYIKEQFVSCQQDLKTAQYELLTSTKSGEDVWLNVTLTPILNSEGKLSKIVCIDSNITNLKNAEQEIIQQKEEIEAQKDELQDQRDFILDQKQNIENQKEELAKSLEKLKKAQNKLVESEKMAALGNLVAGVAHEINTPIGIGVGASSSLFTKTEQIEELFNSKKMTFSNLQAYLESTTQACDLLLSNLTRTADLVKSFKQVSVDNMTENKRTFRLKNYLNDIVRSLAPKFKNRPIDLHIECAENIELNSYPGAFAQIFTNFIINSLLHGFQEQDKGIISIKAEKDDKNLNLTYIDTGKGIPESNLSKVFDPFFTTNMQNGTGLGMNITYNLVTQKIGGQISLKSKEGQGVTFEISIPLENIT